MHAAGTGSLPACASEGKLECTSCARAICSNSIMIFSCHSCQV